MSKKKGKARKKIRTELIAPLPISREEGKEIEVKYDDTKDTCYNTILSGVIKQRRMAKDLSQRDMSNGTGISLPVYGKIDRGYTTITTVHLWKIADILDTTASIINLEVENLVSNLTKSGWTVSFGKPVDKEDVFLSALGIRGLVSDEHLKKSGIIEVALMSVVLLEDKVKAAS